MRFASTASALAEMDDVRASIGKSRGKKTNGNGHAVGVTAAPQARPISTAEITEKIETLALSRIDRSPTNPRTIFDEAKLKELGDNILAVGLLQPIIVREKRSDLAHNDFSQAVVKTLGIADLRYEIVAGERRYRAAKLAGMTHIKAIVRTMTDAQVREFQLIENVQRQDLSPLEEAQGYADLVKNHGYTAETLAKKIGKSRSAIYAAIKLDDLPPKAKEALAGGALARSTAELIARVPDAKSRAAVVREALEADWKGEMLSFREVKRLIERDYCTQLKGVGFSLNDAGLVPSAGACTACPKMAGNNREDYPDARADICTDPSCFKSKVEAHNARASKKLKSGERSATADEQKKLYPAGPHLQDGSFIELADQCWQDSKSRSYKKLLEGSDVKIVVAFDDRGKAHRLVKKDEAQKILREKKIIKGRGEGRSADEEKYWLEQPAIEKSAQRIIDLASSAVNSASASSPAVARFIALLCITHAGDGQCKAAAKAREVSGKDYAWDSALCGYVAKADGGDCFALAVELMMERARWYLNDGHTVNGKTLAAALVALGIDPKEELRKAKAELAAKAAAKKK